MVCFRSKQGLFVKITMVLLMGDSSFKLKNDNARTLRKFMESGFTDFFDRYTRLSTGKDLKDTEVVTFKSGDDILNIHQAEMVTVRYGVDAISNESGGWIGLALYLDISMVEVKVN